MTCRKLTPSIIVCIQPWGRLKLGNSYVWLDYHPYLGPSFYRDAARSKLYEPIDELDPIWPVFGAWLDKFEAAKRKRMARTKP